MNRIRLVVTRSSAIATRYVSWNLVSCCTNRRKNRTYKRLQ